MNKNIKNYLTLLISVLVIFGALIGVDLLVRPIIEDNAMKERIEVYSEILDDIEKIKTLEITDTDGVGVTDKQAAYNSNDELIGYLYTANKVNNWGSITIRMAIDSSGKILGATANVDQSLRAAETKAYIIAHVDMNVDKPDAISGPTTKDSVYTADEIIKAIAKSHALISQVVELTELEEIYGIGAVLELDETFIATNNVLARNEVLVDGIVVGLIYKVKGTGIYVGTKEASIIIDFALDNDGIYLGQIIDLENYGHTAGFRDSALTVLDGIVDTNINDLIVEDLDTSTGATNTATVITKMLEDLKTIFEPYVELTELEEIYGIGAVLELDETFTATEEVLERNEVLVEGIVVGLIYKVKGTGIYVGTKEASIIIDFALDNDGVYLGQIVDLDNYEHTPGFRDSALTVLAGIVDTNINDLIIEDLDTSTGATNTTTVITEMLSNLKEVI